LELKILVDFGKQQQEKRKKNIKVTKKNRKQCKVFALNQQPAVLLSHMCVVVVVAVVVIVIFVPGLVCCNSI